MAESKINRRNQPCPQERRLKISNGLKRHGHCASATTGVTPEFRSWASMRGRCLNPRNKKYPDYGGRGIKICERWDKFENFLEDMGFKPARTHSLNRIDNNGDYTPENCEWADAITQVNNRRITMFFTANGKTQSLGQCAREIGISYKILWRRKRDGWTNEDVVNIPTTAIGGNQRNKRLFINAQHPDPL